MMRAYPNFRDLERSEGVCWNELTALEPRLGELLWDARRACISCRRWSEVEQAFAPFRNSLAELVGFAAKNHKHPILGSPGAYQIAYWKLFDAVAGLFACRERAAANEHLEKQRVQIADAIACSASNPAA